MSSGPASVANARNDATPPGLTADVLTRPLTTGAAFATLTTAESVAVPESSVTVRIAVNVP